MNFLADHFWKIFFIVGALIGSWFGYDRYVKTEAWEGVLQSYKAGYNAIDKSPNAKDEDSQGNYWKFLASLYYFKEGVTNEEIKPIVPKDVSEDASDPNAKNAMDWLLASFGGSERSSQLVIEGIRANLLTCEKFKVFSAANLQRMQSGHEPLIETGIWRDEPLVIALRLPIFATRETCHHPANFVLLPESIAAIEPTEVDDPTKGFASKLKQASIISQRSMDAINRLNDQAKK
jgi:hypothetical protein